MRSQPRRGSVAGCLLAATLAALLTLAPASRAASQTPAEDAQAAFDRANALYDRGDFDAAEALYVRVLRAAPWSVPARYNLANALARQGRTAEALRHYLGVLRRSPRDAAARHNAELARTRLEAAMPAGGTAVIAGPARAPLSWVSPAERAWGALGAMYLLAALAAAALLRPRLRPVAAGAALLILVAAAGFGVAAVRAALARADALVTGSEAVARAGPSPDGPAVLALPAGAALRLRERRDGWVFASLPNGLSGWVPAADLAPVP
ncbi:MAG: tetratricopeptide repeat protein [Gemmatimonadota bacterium]